VTGKVVILTACLNAFRQHTQMPLVQRVSSKI